MRGHNDESAFRNQRRPAGAADRRDADQRSSTGFPAHQVQVMTKKMETSAWNLTQLKVMIVRISSFLVLDCYSITLCSGMCIAYSTTMHDAMLKYQRHEMDICIQNRLFDVISPMP